MSTHLQPIACIRLERVVAEVQREEKGRDEQRCRYAHSAFALTPKRAHNRQAELANELNPLPKRHRHYQLVIFEQEAVPVREEERKGCEGGGENGVCGRRRESGVREDEVKGCEGG
jgi:hypothetical protein